MPATDFQKEIARKFREELQRTSVAEEGPEYFRLMTKVMIDSGVQERAARGVCGRAVQKLLRRSQRRMTTSVSPFKITPRHRADACAHERQLLRGIPESDK